MALTEKLIAIADAIRRKTGRTEEMSLEQMVTEIEGISTGGGEDNSLYTSIIDRSIEHINDDKITSVGESAFRNCRKLIDVTLRNVTVVNNYGFDLCEALKTVELEKAEVIRGFAFSSCLSLETVYLPSAYGRLYAQAFSGCKSLKSVHIPLITEIEQLAFTNSGLEFIDLPKCTKFYNSVFEGSSLLKTIVLRHNAVVTMSNAYVLNRTPFASGGTGGTVYVPAALIESYKTATNWVTLYEAGTCNFVAIEGSEYE